MKAVLNSDTSEFVLSVIGQIERAIPGNISCGLCAARSKWFNNFRCTVNDSISSFPSLSCN